ncbi:hypothetical protein ABE509_06005 [[Pseudomonas] hibiscicola]|uniref:hypothetical protein n=1 Tax=Stenotrophomonas TaxID=40323 RepID=UPI0013116D7F|nr:hypothetical protein [Stenotrophomonas sp. Sm10]MDQ7312351.1 hypothetical protein [Stenotrophomonas sp. Sm10]
MNAEADPVVAGRWLNACRLRYDMLLWLSLSVVLGGCGSDRKGPEATRLQGRIGGVALEVPRQDVWIWEQDRDARADPASRCGVPLRSVSIQLRWPEMAPRNAQTRQDYDRRDSAGNGDSNWIDIGMSQAGEGENITLRQIRDWGLYRLHHQRLPAEVTFDFGRDAALGLEMARPALPERQSFNWNRITYTDSLDPARAPTVLIRCMTGPQYSPPQWTPLCEASLEQPGLRNVRTTVVYRQNLLPHWQEIQADVQAYLQRIRSHCPTHRNVKEIERG